MLTLEQAAAEVSKNAEATKEPVIEPGEVKSITEAHAYATIHAVSTAYAVGAIVLPATGNGRQYECIEAGTTGATAPDWPLTRRARMAQSLRDGSVTWEDDGPCFDELYDVNGATKAVLLRKIAQTVDDMDFAEGPTKVELSQRHAHLVRLAARYEPMF